MAECGNPPSPCALVSDLMVGPYHEVKCIRAGRYYQTDMPGNCSEPSAGVLVSLPSSLRLFPVDSPLRKNYTRCVDPSSCHLVSQQEGNRMTVVRGEGTRPPDKGGPVIADAIQRVRPLADQTDALFTRMLRRLASTLHLYPERRIPGSCPSSSNHCTSASLW